MKEVIKKFIREEDGVGVIEIILILGALITLGLLFKDAIIKLFNTLFKSITDNTTDLDVVTPPGK